MKKPKIKLRIKKSIKKIKESTFIKYKLSKTLSIFYICAFLLVPKTRMGQVKERTLVIAQPIPIKTVKTFNCSRVNKTQPIELFNPTGQYNDIRGGGSEVDLILQTLMVSYLVYRIQNSDPKIYLPPNLILEPIKKVSIAPKKSLKKSEQVLRIPKEVSLKKQYFKPSTLSPTKKIVSRKEFRQFMGTHRFP